MVTDVPVSGHESHNRAAVYKLKIWVSHSELPVLGPVKDFSEGPLTENKEVFFHFLILPP